VPRARRYSVGQQAVNVETHPYNDLIIPQLRITKQEIDFLHDNMPFPELLEMPIHGWMHIIHMLVYASELCNYSKFDLEVVRWAILTHDSGRYHDDMQESEHPLMGAYVAGRMIEKGRINVDAEQVMGVVRRHVGHDKAISSEEAVLRTCDRLDLWRLKNFSGLEDVLMDAPGWRTVEKIAKKLRLAGGNFNDLE